MMRINELLQGRIPLAQAFWTYTIAYGTLLNGLATGAMFIAIAAGVSAGPAVLIHLLPLPYNAVAMIGVWRSASVYPGPSHLANLARLGTALWFAVMLIV